jgi:hypothetical protein
MERIALLNGLSARLGRNRAIAYAASDIRADY